MANKKAADTLSYLERFAKGGIDMNCQLVLCRGINDGAELRRTLDDLLALRPQVGSIAVVPAGLTSYRKGLFPADGLRRRIRGRNAGHSGGIQPQMPGGIWPQHRLSQ